MPRIRIKVAYVGTRYHGWQVQARGESIQGALEQRLARICEVDTRVHGSGRTDAGVHAIGQIAHFDVPESKKHIPWQKALNSMLPDDIAILDAAPVAPSFHSRFSATGKRYAYTLWLEPDYVLPQRAPFVWPVRSLDMEGIDEAICVLCGQHDFASFQNAGTDVSGTVRTLQQIAYGPGLCPQERVFTFQSDGFLKQMVRNLMGTLVAVGRGILSPADVRNILQATNRQAAPGTAPPQGLCLEEVFYDDDAAAAAEQPAGA